MRYGQPRSRVSPASGPVHVVVHEPSASLGQMAERILAAAPARFALAGHSMGGRVALEIMARAAERVTRLALLDTGFEMLAAGEAGERERAGRYRLRDIARTEGMLAMGRQWALGMVHAARLGDEPLMNAIHQMIARALAGAVRDRRSKRCWRGRIAATCCRRSACPRWFCAATKTAGARWRATWKWRE